MFRRCRVSSGMRASTLLRVSGAHSTPISDHTNSTTSVSQTQPQRGENVEEVSKFRDIHSRWWDPQGPLRTLHMLNPTRVEYIIQCIRSTPFGADFGNLGAGVTRETAAPIRVLDVGCGVGVLSESLARVGAQVTSVDACEESIKLAKARQDAVAAQRASLGLSSSTNPSSQPPPVEYVFQNLFTLSTPSMEAAGGKFDVVIASEVMEHVDEPAAFLKRCCDLVRPGGILIISTMDKSLLTAATGIVAAEYILGLLPPGTHDWRKFLPPQDVERHAARHGVTQIDLSYAVSYPDPSASIAAGNLFLKVFLSKSIRSGHYFWCGCKHDEPGKEL